MLGHSLYSGFACLSSQQACQVLSFYPLMQSAHFISNNAAVQVEASARLGSGLLNLTCINRTSRKLFTDCWSIVPVASDISSMIEASGSSSSPLISSDENFGWSSVSEDNVDNSQSLQLSLSSSLQGKEDEFTMSSRKQTAADPMFLEENFGQNDVSDINMDDLSGGGNNAMQQLRLNRPRIEETGTKEPNKAATGSLISLLKGNTEGAGRGRINITQWKNFTDDKDGFEETEFEYYMPEVGDRVMGIVVSGTENKLDIEIGAHRLGLMIQKEAMPLDKSAPEILKWDSPGNSFAAPNIPTTGQARLVGSFNAASMEHQPGQFFSVGTVLYGQVIGITDSGRAVLSAREVARQIAWQRIKQIRDMEEIIEVVIESCNLGGLICTFEGIRAFLPLKFIQNSFSPNFSMKDYIGKRMRVLVVELKESENQLIISERAAWVLDAVKPGSLVEGVVTKVLDYGIVVKLDGTDISGLIHISNITNQHVPDIRKTFTEGEKVKAVVIPSPKIGKLSLSTAALETSRGLMLQDKEKVYFGANKVLERRKYKRDKFVQNVKQNKQHFKARAEAEERVFANREWFDFGLSTERGNEPIQ